MSLIKAIKSGKEHRKEYRGGKAVSGSCRNHGNCPWCEGNRTYKNKKYIEKVKEEMRFKKMNLDILIVMMKEFDYKRNGKKKTIDFLEIMIQYFNELDF